MERDMDLVRDLLLHIEGDPQYDGQRWLRPEIPSEMGSPHHSIEEIAYHLNLLVEAGYLRGMTVLSGMPAISRMTWQGHEFLDNIRDEDVWSKTKERIKGLSGIALGVVAQIAEAEIKKRLGLS